jgi:translation initiation factor RLI1
VCSGVSKVLKLLHLHQNQIKKFASDEYVGKNLLGKTTKFQIFEGKSLSNFRKHDDLLVQ